MLVQCGGVFSLSPRKTMMRSNEIMYLDRCFQDASGALTKLRQALEPFHESVPGIFPKTVGELSATETMKVSHNILLLIKKVVECQN